MCSINLMPTTPKLIFEAFENWSSVKKLVFATILAVFSAILQSAGGFLPGVGFFISPFSTMTILLATMVSLRYGYFAYLVTIFLLILVEPTELFIFPFATGLLGLGLGWCFRRFKQRMIIALINGGILSLGICIPLYGLGFPILGPVSPTAFELKTLGIIFVFAFLYSWLWISLGLYIFKKLSRILSQPNKNMPC